MESINRPIYRFFSFRTSERMASEYGHCSGQVNLQTGEILANISYGLFHYRETYQLNLADSISQFPHTTKELIICAARHAANEEGVRGMTRRRVIFVCKDGRRYITEEYNGDRSEYAARGHCLDSCDMDWSEIRDIFQEPATYTQFIKANLRAQAAYHSFLSENGNSGIVRNLRKGREGPYADKILFVYAAPLATGGRIFETNYTWFTPVPGFPYPACTGQGKKPCLECPLRQSFQTAELAQLQAEHNWPRAVHTDGDDAYLIGSQSSQAGLVPVYLFPDCQCALSSETLYPAEEYYRLREILRNDPSAFDDQCDLFRSYPLDWYKELALYAMRCVARTHGSPMAESVHDQNGQTAHHISKAIFEEQDLFDPYTDAAFLAAAERILPWYIRRYVNR